MIRTGRAGLSLALGAMLVAGAVVAPRAAWAAPAGPPAQIETSIVEIASPAANAVISGLVQIVGTAIDPAFYQYELAYASDPLTDDAWTPIQQPVGQQVREGVLGEWNTTQVVDGRYLLRLRVVRRDGTSKEHQVSVQVVNATATPLPTPLPTFTSTPLPGTPTPGPSPTSLIWQPPTRTPRPTATPGGPTPTPKPASLEDAPFRPERLQQAACTGLWVTLGVFGFLAIYGIGRAARRGQLRSWWWHFQREVINPLLDSGGRRRKRKG